MASVLCSFAADLEDEEPSLFLFDRNFSPPSACGQLKGEKYQLPYTGGNYGRI